MYLSVVIPTLNEEQELPETLRRAQAVPEVTEIIISDGGSTDRTLAVAQSAKAQIVTGGAGRGAQLRRGAEQATGDVVVLLHADTWLPHNAGQALVEALGSGSDIPSGANRPIVGGGFQKSFRDASWGLRSTARWRSRAYFQLTGRFFGDQAIFVRRDRLTAIGGVPPLPLMEEFALCRELKKIGQLVLVQAAVCTSARRFRDQGALRTWWMMFRLQVSWSRGTAPTELHRRYYSNTPRHRF